MTCERCGTQRNVERSEELGVTLRGDCFAAGADATQIAIGVRARVHEVLDAMPEDGRPRDERLDEAVRIALGNARAERFWSERNGDEPEVEPPLRAADRRVHRRQARGARAADRHRGRLHPPGARAGAADRQGRQGQDDVRRRAWPSTSPAGSTGSGFAVPRPLNVLFIENEGPREPFRRKLERKLAALAARARGRDLRLRPGLGHARLDVPEFVERLNEFCDEHEIDLVIGDPLDSLGMEGEGSPVGDPRDGRPLQGRWAVLRAGVDGAAPLAQGVGPGRGRRGRRAPGAGDPTRCSALEKRKDNRARLTFAKVRWQGRERNPYLLAFDPETETFSFVKEEEARSATTLAEIEEFLEENPPMTSREIAGAISSGRDKIENTLEGHPDRFERLTGEAAKAAGRHSNAVLWCLAPPQKPDGPTTISRGAVMAGMADWLSGFPPIGKPDPEARPDGTPYLTRRFWSCPEYR